MSEFVPYHAGIAGIYSLEDLHFACGCLQETAMKSKGCLATAGSGDQSGEEALSPLPQPPARSRRGAVSAETYSEEDATNYVKKVRTI